MITHDTIELLKKCDAGIKMGIKSIDEIKDRIDDENFKKILENSKNTHKSLEKDIGNMLRSYGEEEQNPSAMALSMSWMKTNMKMSINESDNTASDLIIDGCNMGVKSLQKYLNEYEKANEDAKSITKKTIEIEEKLAEDLKKYL